MQSGIPIVKLERLKVFRCGDCDKIFPTETGLADHGKWHDLQEYLDQPGVLDHFKSAFVKLHRVHIFQCGLCSRAFLGLHQFLDHQASAHNKQKTKQTNSTNIDDTNNNELKKPYKCTECGWRFVAKSTLQAHSAVHAPMHTCFCGVAFYRLRDLNAHRRLVHPTNLTWKQEIKYKVRKPASEFAIKPEPESDSDSAPKSIKPRLKAELVKKKKPKKKANVKREKRKITINKENISGPPYHCDVCSKFFIKFSHYKTHLILHTDRAFKCPDCGKLFTNKRYLENHMVVHTGEKPYPCDICNKRFTQSGALYTHLKTVHAKLKEYKCEQCGKTFSLKDRLRRHEVIHSGLKPYVCPFETCKKGFADQSALGRHVRTHTGECKYFCPHCPAAYSDKSAYNTHIDRAHLNKQHKCEICGKILRNLRLHMQLQHQTGKVQQFECDHCGKTFITKRYLVLHMELQHLSTERKYKCDFCPKMFKHKTYCDTHMSRIHWKKKAFVCDYCNMVFNYKRILMNHIKANHVGIPLKYQCDICHRRLAKKKSILKHIVFQHLCIKCDRCTQMFYTPFELRKHKCKQCIQCDRYFGTSRKLSVHKKREHSDKNEILNSVENSFCITGL